MIRSRLNTLARIGLMAGAVAIVSCSQDDDNSGDEESFDRQALLVNMADNVIIPAYAALISPTGELVMNAEAFKNDVNQANLDQLREAYRSTAFQWQSAAFYDFGPASNQALISSFNLYPISVDDVQANINSGTYNLESAANLDASGLQAIDYLLYGTGNNDAEVLQYFSDNPNAAVYIEDIANLLNQKALATVNAWEDGYRSTFVSATGTDIGSSLGQLVNATIQYYEIHLRDAKIGIPSGARSSTLTPRPEQVEGYYSNSFSRDLLVESISAFQEMFNGIGIQGTDGIGMDDYLAYLGPSFNNVPLQVEINNRLNAAKTEAQELNNSLADAVVNQQDQALEVFDELQRVIVLLKVDMTSAMGIQITYQDNDGD